MNNEIKFFDEEPVQLEKIKVTYELAFHTTFNSKYWKWRFLNNPFSTKTQIAYILDKNVLAAFYAVCPTELLVNGIKKKSALSLMTMTHPKYSGRGLFRTLAHALFEKLKMDDFVSVFGFANVNSHYGFRKYLGWKDLVPIYNLQADMIKPIDQIFNYKIGDVDENIIDMIGELKTEKAVFSFSRSIEFLKWRLIENPNNQYKYCIVSLNHQVESIAIYKEYGESIDIMEIFYNSNFDQHILMQSVFYHLLDSLKIKINYWSNFNSNEHLFLEKIGFKPHAFNSYFGVVPLPRNSPA